MSSRILLAATILLASFLPLYAADAPAAGPNADPTYQQLRKLTLGGEAVSVSNFDLKRDAGTFHLHSGTVCFVPPVQGQGHRGGFRGRWQLRPRPAVRIRAPEPESCSRKRTNSTRVSRKPSFASPTPPMTTSRRAAAQPPADAMPAL